MSIRMEQTQAEAVYDVLVRSCGAAEQLRHAFVCAATTPAEWGLEFRFVGALGFGGKVHYAGGTRPPRVSYYAEDRNPTRADAVSEANTRLAALWENA